MAGRHTRNLIRVLTGAALCMALVACVAVPVPEDLPAVAVGQAGLYRLEVTLLVFHGALLLITPAFSGLIGGRLPIEISTRGAKFAEETGLTSERHETAIKELEWMIKVHSEGLDGVKLGIERLEERMDSDNTKRGVGSNE
jgi:hypothetical protein